MFVIFNSYIFKTSAITVLMQAHLRSLFTFTSIYVDAARRDARHGRKDDARDFLRFVRNASIIPILKQYENSGSVFDIDVAHLEWKLRELENDCHPSAQCDFKDDFSAIRASLEIIAGGVNQLLSKSSSQSKP